jgi:hypothetical protein
VKADVTDHLQLRVLFEAAEREYGGLDAFVHNDEVAPAWNNSDDARWITGQGISVDGGLTA